MKEYKRLTNNDINEYSPEIDFCTGCRYYGEPNGCNRKQGSCDNYDRFNEMYNRLAELEDKIENGELIFTMQNEQGNKEIEFFVKHNAEIRKETAREILKTIRDISICPVTTGYVVIDGADWLELFQKYGVEVE